MKNLTSGLDFTQLAIGVPCHGTWRGFSVIVNTYNYENRVSQKPAPFGNKQGPVH
ncbi:MAG: hypothetical protein IKT27_05465 [Clostridia bacterium]|nr:hypothetical protein [Clostridia bacterium]